MTSYSVGGVSVWCGDIVAVLCDLSFVVCRLFVLFVINSFALEQATRFVPIVGNSEVCQGNKTGWCRPIVEIC